MMHNIIELSKQFIDIGTARFGDDAILAVAKARLNDVSEIDIALAACIGHMSTSLSCVGIAMGVDLKGGENWVGKVAVEMILMLMQRIKSREMMLNPSLEGFERIDLIINRWREYFGGILEELSDDN